MQQRASAGMSHGSIYWHLRNKDQLLEAVLTFSRQPLQDRVAAAGDAHHWADVGAAHHAGAQGPHAGLFQPPNKPALQVCIYLMGLIRMWLFVPRLSLLCDDRSFFHRQCMQTLDPQQHAGGG